MKELYPLRKRPSQLRSQRVFDAILAAAEVILVRDGYGALTTNAIAEQANISVGSLYQYFPDKKTVVVHMLEQKLNAIATAAADTLLHVDGPRPLIEYAASTLKTTLDLWRKEGAVLAKLLEISDELRIQEHMEHWMAGMVDEFLDRNGLQRRHEGTLALKLVSQCVTHIHMHHATETVYGRSSEQVARLLAEMMIPFLSTDPNTVLARSDSDRGD